MERARRKIPLWMRIAIGVMLALFALAAAGVALRYWITSDGGRAFIVSQIDGRRIGPLGTIRISGLQGDPLDAATVADITLVDDEGIWLRAKDARLEWTPTELLAGQLEIRAIKIRKVDMLRSPRTTYQNENNPPPDIGLRLDQIEIDEFEIADNVIGPNAKYRISGGAAQGRNGGGFARLVVAPISGPADRADISAEWTEEGTLKGQVAIAGPAGGLVSVLTQAPEDDPVTLSASLSGTIIAFDGKAQLTFGAEPVATILISRKADEATLGADIAAGDWPLLDAISSRTGDTIRLDGHANLADMLRAPVTLTLTSPTGKVDLSGTADLEAMGINGPVQINASGLDLAAAAPPLTGKLDASGLISLVGLLDFEWTGKATATSVTWPSGGAARLATPITLAKRGSAITWEAPSATVTGGYVSSLKSLAPARYTVATRGEVNLRTRIVEIGQAQVRGAPGDATARGTYNIDSGAIALTGSASFAQLADVAPLSGSARGQWTVRRTSLNAPIRITVDVAGRNVSSTNDILAELAGASPTVKLAGVVRDGRFTVESGSVEGAGVRANMTGRIADSGAITAQATGSLTRPLDLSGASLDALSFVANISGDTSAPRVALDLSDGAVTAAGVTVENISGEAQARLGDRVAGDFSLAGGSTAQPLIAAGRLEGGDGAWRIVNLNASLGQLRLTAPRLAYDDGAFSASFDASGSLAGIAGFDRGTLTAKGTLALGDDLKVDVTGRLSDLRNGQMRLDLLTFDADASGNRATLAAQAKGRFGAPVDIALKANGVRSGQAWSGDATLNGTVDQLPVNTTRPARWTYAASGWKLDAELAAFEGQLDAMLAASDTTASASFDMQRVQLSALSRLARIPPIKGLMTGKATFENGPGPATADFQIAVTDANPVGVTADPVSFNITGALRNGALVSKSSGSGQGFKLEASSGMQVIVGNGFDVRPDMNGVVQGSVTLAGRAEQLWAVFGPDDQSLRGQISADVQMSGTMSRPDLTGGFDIAGGAYEHSETGLRLRDLVAHGEFDQHSARISGLTAQDGRGGRLAGDGTIEWGDAVSGGVNFSATDLHALGRDDREAIVSGDGKVTLGADAINVAGDFRVNQARFSVEQPASSKIQTLPGLRRTNFLNQDEIDAATETPTWRRPVQLDLKVAAPRRIFVFGRGLDTEWGANFHVTGPISDPSINGTARLERGSLDLGGRRFQFDSGTIEFDGPIRTARIDISAERSADDVTARVRVTGSPTEPKFVLESTPSLPQDEIMARVLFGRTAGELSGFEAAQLATGLAQLAGGQAGFDPVGLVRKATGLDRVAFGAEGGVTTVSAGKYIAEDVYLQVGAGGEGGVGAEVEWEPRDNLSIISSAQGNGDTKISVRWKRDY